MVNDEQLRIARADGGKEGKEFGQLGAEHGHKGGRPNKNKGGFEEKQKPPPSSSSSSSSSSSKPKGDKSPSTPKSPLAPSGPDAIPVTLPNWLAEEDWEAFTEHRKRLKAPMSEVAQVRAIAELSRLRGIGHDPTAVLNQSIVNGWKGLFELKRHEAHGFNRQAALEARNAQACLEAKALIFGEMADAIP
jgi:hypothetical protein